MIALKEGEKRTIRAQVKRGSGTGAITLTTPQRRILTDLRALVTGFNWTDGGATWTADDANATGELSALFDSTLPALATPGVYFVQLRGVISPELYQIEIKVEVEEAGP